MQTIVPVHGFSIKITSKWIENSVVVVLHWGILLHSFSPRNFLGKYVDNKITCIPGCSPESVVLSWENRGLFQFACGPEEACTVTKQLHVGKCRVEVLPPLGSGGERKPVLSAPPFPCAQLSPCPSVLHPLLQSHHPWVAKSQRRSGAQASSQHRLKPSGWLYNCFWSNWVEWKQSQNLSCSVKTGIT